MFKRIYSIIILCLFLLSGSGINYLVSVYYARSHARRYNMENLKKDNEIEKIQINIDDFNYLQKKTISSTVFEIRWNNKQYDIFKTELISSKTIVLYAKHDKQEEAADKDLISAHSFDIHVKKMLVFFQLNLLQPATTTLFVLQIRIFNYLNIPTMDFKNFRLLISPPPWNAFA